MFNEYDEDDEDDTIFRMEQRGNNATETKLKAIQTE